MRRTLATLLAAAALAVAVPIGMATTAAALSYDECQAGGGVPTLTYPSICSGGQYNGQTIDS